MQILTVCTGNICRSPLAEVVLQSQFDDADVQVSSAGTQGLDSAPMTTDAQRLATLAGVPAEMAAAHRSRFLTENLLQGPDLILALTREHRTRILEMRPAVMRRTFTAREFARVAATMTDDDLLAIAGTGESATRLTAMVGALAARRNQAKALQPSDDDVVDPYRKPWSVYEESAAQLLPALTQVQRVVSLSLRK